MATEQPVFMEGSCAAGVDLRTHQYKAVKLTAASTVGLTTVAGEPFLGVLQDTPNTGEPANVMILGKTKAIGGAAVAAGVRVMTNNAGQIITAATTGSTCCGWSVEACAALGNKFTIILTPAGIF